jgi:hypothetical protein
MSRSDFEDIDKSRQQFYQWAFSDFCDDDLKGIFAEWMVSELLNCPSLRRFSWADNGLSLSMISASTSLPARQMAA